MRAMSIAIEAPGYADLPAYLKNEGHPILWYAVLKLAFSIFHDTSVLPILSFLFAAGIAFILLFRSPFPLLFSTLIIFGTWCLYDYGINCRNYGIGAFLMLLFADLYTRNKNRPILYASILALAAQSNVYACIMSMLAGAWMLWEQPPPDRLKSKSLLSAGILLASFVFVAYVTWPDQNSLVAERQESWDLLKTFNISYGLENILHTSFPINYSLLTVMFMCAILVFIPKPRAMLWVYTSALIMSFFSICLRHNYIQHQGMWIYFFIVMLYVHFRHIKSFVWTQRGFRKYLICLGFLCFSCILYSHVRKGWDTYQFDLRSPMSDSKHAGTWFRQHAKPGDVILAEPDYVMEPVMFYHYQHFYLPREKRFNSYVHFTKANDSFLSLRNLINTTDSFEQAGKRTFLVIREKLLFKDTIFRYSYGKHFIVDTGALKDLDTRYFITDSFRNNYYTDEQYYIYMKR